MVIAATVVASLAALAMVGDDDPRETGALEPAAYPAQCVDPGRHLGR